MTQGQGSNSLHLSGSKVPAANFTLDVNATNAVQHMKQELSRLRAENETLVNQLNCFISLVQRSWRGDTNATIHLSNIIGLEPPQSIGTSDMSQTPTNTQAKIKIQCQQRWERLTKKLLERDELEAQRELREYQYRYLENREAYMDAVLQDHHQTMGVIPLSRQNSSSSILENIDSRFIKHNKALQRLGGHHTRRVQSAKARPPTAKRQEVKAMDISLRDLVGDVPSSNHFVDSETLGEKQTITAFSRRRPQTSHPRYPVNTYNDPARYSKPDVFDVRETDGVRKPRPVSASSLRDADAVRSRPRSGSIGKRDRGERVPVPNQRSLRYETTKPVYNQPKQPKVKVKHLSEDQATPLQSTAEFITTNTFGMDHSQSNVSPAYDDSEENSDHFKGDVSERNIKPPMSIKVKRPAHVDQFIDQERAMRNMEEDFRKKAVSLQKKLGIEDRGIIALD